jgi:hypothetical protein
MLVLQAALWFWNLQQAEDAVATSTLVSELSALYRVIWSFKDAASVWMPLPQTSHFLAALGGFQSARYSPAGHRSVLPVTGV